MCQGLCPYIFTKAFCLCGGSGTKLQKKNDFVHYESSRIVEAQRRNDEKDVRMDDWRFAGLYDEYAKMRAEGTKYCVAVYRLAEKYGVSEATVVRAVRRFGKEC